MLRLEVIILLSNLNDVDKICFMHYADFYQILPRALSDCDICMESLLKMNECKQLGIEKQRQTSLENNSCLRAKMSIPHKKRYPHSQLSDRYEHQQ